MHSEVIGDIAPLLVRQGTLLGAQAQRAVPHIGGLVPVRYAFLSDGVPAEILLQDLNAEGLAGLVQVPRNRDRVVAVQDPVVVPGHDRRVPCHQVRVGVGVLRLIRIGGGQVHQET